MTRFWKRLLVLAMSGVLALPFSAAAQQKTGKDIDEDDEDEEQDIVPVQPQREAGPVVEVARGFYIQADPGSFDYLGALTTPGFPNRFGQGLSWGNSIRIHAGTDLITAKGFGLSAQATFWQVVNKGIYAPDALPTQGATRSSLFEVSVRPTLLLGSSGRLNVFARAGGGVGFLHLARTDAPTTGLYSSFESGLAPKPFFGAGAGVEYYTRLSHFSFTFLEVNALYFPGLDVALAINFAGFKYTF